MIQIKRPMLAAKVVTADTGIEDLPLPLLGSPKLDGIRAFSQGKVVYSRRLKPIPSQQVQKLYGSWELHGMDGELIVGSPSDPEVYNRTQSVMAADKELDVKFWVFDDWSLGFDVPYEARLSNLADRVRTLKAQGIPIGLVNQERLVTIDDVLKYEKKCILGGFEGAMVRSLTGGYTQSRTNWKSKPWLWKLKRTEDFEAEIVEVHEKLHNDNPAMLNELGLTKRSGHKENKRPAGTLGGFTMRRLADGVTFRAPMGSGWTDAKKHELWMTRDLLIGQVWVVESLMYGEKDRPRQPKVKGPRHSTDMPTEEDDE